MLRVLSLAVLSGILVALPAHGKDGFPASGGEQPMIEVLGASQEGFRMVLELPDLAIEDVAGGGETFQLVSIPGGGLTGEVGEPAIPTFSRLVAIPEGATLNILATPTEVEEIAGQNLLPMQADGEEDDFAYDELAYARASFDDAPEVRVGEPMSFRDLRVAPLTFQPVHYNPASRTLRVTRRMEVEIEFQAADTPGPVTGRRSTIPPSFDRLYRELVVNYLGPESGQSVAPGTYLMICQDNATVIDLVQPLLEWRKRQGFTTILATTSQTGTSTNSIKNYIQSVYDDPQYNLEYVALVGDHPTIPTWFESLSGYNGGGDHYYTTLEGGDVLSDIHIGRLSYSTTIELERIVKKVLTYEPAPRIDDPTWFTRGCVAGDASRSGLSAVLTNQWIKERLLAIGYAEVDTVWSDFVSGMRDGLNRGDTVFGYRGWLGMSNWSNGNTYTLTNFRKLPFAVIMTCGTGTFYSGTSLSEGFLRSAYTSGADSLNGGIGAIGTATTGTHTRYNNCIYFGVWRGLLWDEGTTMGASLTRGKLELYLNYQATEPTKVDVWSVWNNVMGDPAVEIWTAYPAPLEVNHAASIALGANSAVVTVSGNEGPVEGAQVCLWKGTEVHVVGTTDAQGRVDLGISPTTAGDMLLTVTKRNMHPYLATIPVAPEVVYVGYLDSVIDDDNLGTSSGNGDGIANPGETIELKVQVKNFGVASAPEATATLTTDDPFVEILDSTESFAAIPGGATAWTPDDFDLRIDPGCPHGHRVQLGLDLNSSFGLWHSLIELEVTSADLVAGTVTLYNSGNGRLDPGETLEMSVELSNGGGATATNVTGTLISLSPFISVSDETGTFGTIGIGGTGNNAGDRFTISADPGTYQGYLASFQLVTTFSGGVTDTTELGLTVGLRTSTDPVGPDRYGYYAFDNTDTGYPEAPTYSWIELDPSYGGNGEQVPLGDYGTYQDKVRIVDMPFTFQYYGQTYDQATICSNGWIAMGSTYVPHYRNWTIPGSGGPNAMIAGFWDDLMQPSGSQAWQKFDEVNHTWTVEWSRFRNDEGATETFEIILYDPNHHPTDTGDGIIAFQYNQVVNNETPDNYATVGIENHDQTDGVLYTFYNRYPLGAATLTAGRAIKFVPVNPGPSGTLEGLTLNASNGNQPLEGVEVEILGRGRTLISGADGFYSGFVPAGTHTVVASHAGFKPDTALAVVVNEGGTTELDFRLIDIAGPEISTTTHRSTENTTGPYPIPVTIVEYSGLAEATLHYRINWGPFTSLPLVPQGGQNYLAEIPGQPQTTTIEYYVYARDNVGFESTDPPGAPAELFGFLVAPMETVLDDPLEAPTGWTVGAPDDDATTGIWVREEPVGTIQGTSQCQPEVDHTPDPGEICFVTGNGVPGGAPGDNDVDGGKTTLFSPVFDLSGFDIASVSYWVWYTNNLGNNPSEDYWDVDVTTDGVTWVSLEHTTDSSNDWVERSFALEDVIELTDQVQLRFVASDYGAGSLVEAAVDDFLLTGIREPTTDLEPGAVARGVVTGLDPCRPNPFNPATTITYRLAAAGEVKLRIYDLSGRLVQTLVEGPVGAGVHELRWDGRNTAGRQVASGIYFLRFEAPGFMQVRQMTLAR